LQQLTKTPQTGSAQVLARFGVRLVILSAFAAFGSIGFGRSLAALLWMSIVLSAVIGTVKREPRSISLSITGTRQWPAPHCLP